MTNEFDQKSSLTSGRHPEELQQTADLELVEAARNQAMDLDLTLLPPVAGELSRYPEGIYEVGQIIDSFVPPDTLPAPEEKADRHRVFTALWVLPNVELLKGKKCYVSPKALAMQDPGSPLARAHTILDRMAELTAESRDLLTLNTLISQIRKEATLLDADTDTVVEDIVRRHPRLRAEPVLDTSTLFSAEPPDQEILRVSGRDYIHLPATIGAAIDRLAVTTNPRLFAPVRWLARIMPKDIQLTDAARHAFVTALTHDPRFEKVRVRYGKSSSTMKYRLLSAAQLKDAPALSSEPRAWKPIKTVEELQNQPLQELARRALDLCGKYDVQELNGLTDRVVADITISDEHQKGAIDERKRDIMETLLYDPRVHTMRRQPDFVTISRMPHDSKRLTTLTFLASSAARSLCVAGEVVEISEDALHDAIIQRAEESRMQLSVYDRQLLRRLGRVNKFVVSPISLADGTPGYGLADAQSRAALIAAEQPPRKRIRRRVTHDDLSLSEDSPAATETELEDAGTAAATESDRIAEARLAMRQKRTELSEALGPAITAELDAAIPKFVKRYVDDNMTTVDMEFALDRLVGMLPSGSLSPAMQEYLKLALATDDRFEFNPARGDRLGVVSSSAERRTPQKGFSIKLDDTPASRRYGLPGSTISRRERHRLADMSIPPRTDDED